MNKRSHVLLLPVRMQGQLLDDVGWCVLEWCVALRMES